MIGRKKNKNVTLSDISEMFKPKKKSHKKQIIGVGLVSIAAAALAGVLSNDKDRVG